MSNPHKLLISYTCWQISPLLIFTRIRVPATTHPPHRALFVPRGRTPFGRLPFRHFGSLTRRNSREPQPVIGRFQGELTSPIETISSSALMRGHLMYAGGWNLESDVRRDVCDRLERDSFVIVDLFPNRSHKLRVDFDTFPSTRKCWSRSVSRPDFFQKTRNTLRKRRFGYGVSFHEQLQIIAEE